MKIGIIGAGNMGQALYHRMAPYFGSDNVWICDSEPACLAPYPATHASTDPAKMINQVAAVIFAIKPQTFEEWKIPLERHLVISIMTGITIQTMAERTGAKKIVRSMPNLALKLGHSLTGWTATKELSQEDKGYVHTLFSLFGKEIEVQQEEQLNAITAISGSGPAYFFYLAAELTRKAEEYGFTPAEARTLATETLMGSAALLLKGDGEAEKLISSIASKGGTTEAALNVFQEHKTDAIIGQAVDAAKKRAQELSK